MQTVAAILDQPFSLTSSYSVVVTNLSSQARLTKTMDRGREPISSHTYMPMTTLGMISISP
jgi:hypothetical protein